MWKKFFSFCWFLGHDDQTVVDCEARRSFNKCSRCGREHQYDFQAELPKAWVGWCDKAHSCPLCFGWKPQAWDRCANEICSLNPDGMLRFRSDGSAGYDLDGPRRLF